MLRVNISLFILVAYVLFSDRVFLMLDTGGRGVFPILDVALPLVILFSAFTLSGVKSLSFLKAKELWTGWGPFLLLTLLLPILGVLFNGYPERSILASLSAVVALSLIMLGYQIHHLKQDVYKLIQGYFLLAITIQLAFILAQVIHRAGYFADNPILNILSNWDLMSQSAYSDSYILVGRSTGTYINPNTLGFWGVLTFWLSAYILKGGKRMFGMLSSFSILILSQSRGALFALIMSVLFSMLLGTSGGRERSKFTSLIVIPGTLLALTITLVLLSDLASSWPIVERFAAGFRVLWEGNSADANWEERVLAWQQAWIFYGDHPFGTLGSPELTFGQFIDNEYIRLLLQGNVIYLASFVLPLLGALTCVKRSHQDALLAIFSLSIGVAAISSTPLVYPPFAFYWICVGIVISSQHRQLLSPPHHLDTTRTNSAQ